MFPPVHPAVAYLLYAGGLRALDRAPPGGVATVALIVGATLPDLVDLPLAAVVDVPSTRTVGHTLLTALPVTAVGALAIRRSDLPDRVASAFAVGLLSHPLADALWPLVVGQYDELGFLAWPITASPAYEGEKPLVELAGRTVTSRWVEYPLLGLGLLAWWRGGRPGLALLASRNE